MTYSTDKCIKLLGYEYELPDEIILIIQKLVVKNKMKECVDEHEIKQKYQCRSTGTFGMNQIHTGRLYLRYYIDFTRMSRNTYRWSILPIPQFDANHIFGLYVLCHQLTLGISTDAFYKEHIVEVMKNHGIKFNKSKKKSDLFNIFIKNKCFIE